MSERRTFETMPPVDPRGHKPISLLLIKAIIADYNAAVGEIARLKAENEKQRELIGACNFAVVMAEQLKKENERLAGILDNFGYSGYKKDAAQPTISRENIDGDIHLWNDQVHREGILKGGKPATAKIKDWACKTCGMIFQTFSEWEIHDANEHGTDGDE